MKTAVIYSRVSTQEQNFQSQIEDLQRFAKIEEIEIKDIFAEKASGFYLNADRSEYDRMKEFVIKNKIPLVLCWELSRFGRNTLHTLNEIQFFTNNGIDIFFKKENIHTISEEPTSKLLLTLLSSIAELERNAILSRSIRGKLSSAQKGKRTGFAIMPYGFDADDQGYIVINEEEAEIIRLIYNWYDSGFPIREIATKLNSMGVKTRRNKIGRKSRLKTGFEFESSWRHNTIRKILHSTLYKGERTYKDNIIVKIPRIISEELWNKVQSHFENNTGYKNTTKYEYLFKGKIECGYCLSTYASESRIKKGILSSHYYCNGRKNPNICCESSQISSRVFDEKVYDALFLDKNAILRIYEEKAKDFNPDEKKKQITYYTGLISQEEKRRKRIVTLFKDGFISKPEFDKDQKKISENITEFENKIRSLEIELDSFSKDDLVEKIHTMIFDADFNTRREYVNEVVEKIKVFTVDEKFLEYFDNSPGFKKDYQWILDNHKDDFRKDENINYLQIFIKGIEKPILMLMGSFLKEYFILEPIEE